MVRVYLQSVSIAGITKTVVGLSLFVGHKGKSLNSIFP